MFTMSWASGSLFLRGIEQLVGHAHGEGGADQRDPGDALGIARRALDGDQRSHAVADQRRLLHAGSVQQRDDPVGHRFDALQRRPLAIGHGPGRSTASTPRP